MHFNLPKLNAFLTGVFIYTSYAQVMFLYSVLQHHFWKLLSISALFPRFVLWQ